ncbi:MAG: TetR/AcrR family transcriptional regulator [Bacteroidales bacterium]|nr:TetR/AcrR family transcriptional regulator [Candidatus Cacconaster merdequi]
MPRQPRFSKDDIVAAGLRIVRTSGFDAVSARALGKELGTSSSPMFTMFKDMNEVMDAIRTAGEKTFTARMEGVTDYFPAFKEFGLRLVAFAKEDPNVFQMLFLGKDARPEIAKSVARECLGSVEQGYGLSPEQANLLVRQMWPVACGIAALCVRHPEDFPEEEVSKTLSYHFSGIMSIIKSSKEVEDVKPQLKEF